MEESCVKYVTWQQARMEEEEKLKMQVLQLSELLTKTINVQGELLQIVQRLEDRVQYLEQLNKADK